MGPVIAGIFMQANQVYVKSDSISASFPSPESYSLIFLVVTLISLSSIVLVTLLSRSMSNRIETSKNERNSILRDYER